VDSAQGSNLAHFFFEDLNQSEKLSENKPPLQHIKKGNRMRAIITFTTPFLKSISQHTTKVTTPFTKKI
jgi:hypothetical protein